MIIKKTIFLFTVVSVLIFTATLAFGGTVVITQGGYEQRTLTFTCTGVISDTTISTDDFNYVRGWYLYRVIIENTSTTVTGDSDVYIRDLSGTDLLNGQGVDELDNGVRNYIRLNRKDPVISMLKIDVDNQAEATGVFTVTVVFAR